MRLIDADALGLEPLTPDVDVSVLFREGFNCAAKQIIEAPTVDPVRHGQWILEIVGKYKDIRLYSCSECGFSLPLNPNKIPRFCEDCGAQCGLS